MEEGGYEAVVSTIYYGLPAPFEPSIEKLIVDKVYELLSKVRPQESAASHNSDSEVGFGFPIR